MVSGRQALATIEGAIAQARGEEARLDAALKSAADDVARLRTERAEAFRALAREKLDAITRDGLVQSLDATERQALDLLAQRRAALETLLAGRKAAEQALQHREAERHAKAAAFEEGLEAFARLLQQAKEQTRASPEGAAEIARIAGAPAIAEEAEKKAAQADSDREGKRKPYEADPLFTYLWRKKFGTAEDRSGPLVRFFDRRVARLVGYDKARANYALLNEIPQRLREHAGRMKAEIANASERLKALEQEAAEKAGIKAAADRVRAAKAELDAAERGLAEAKAALAKLDREHDISVLQGEGPYRDAIELLAAADSRGPLEELYRKASATPSPEDDMLVRRIDATDGALRRAEREMESIQTKLRELTQRRAVIERERDAFRQQGYDRPYSRFEHGSTIGNVLGGILAGVVGGTVLRDVLNGGYRSDSGPWDSGLGGGFPLPDDGGGTWNGGWLGGGDGGGADDGFGTGGSF